MNERGKVEFVGIGAPKCGSSWASECLEEHPDILFAKEKEVNFFNDADEGRPMELRISNFDKGLEWYLDHFPNTKPGQIRGEFSMYMLNESSCQRIYDYNPDIKLLVTLRDPVEMVYSRHWSLLTTIEPKIPKDFNEAIEEGHHLYVGEHYKNLKRYFELFPKKNIHVILFEDIKEKPETVVGDLYDFLGVNNSFRPKTLTTSVNRAAKTKSEPVRKFFQKIFWFIKEHTSHETYQNLRDKPFLSDLYRKLNVEYATYPPIDPKTERKLRDYYSEDVEKLEKLISRDLTSWKK